jgi:hypothetical protein
LAAVAIVPAISSSRPDTHCADAGGPLQPLCRSRVLLMQEGHVMATADVLYSDSLVEITQEAIWFKAYYFPFFLARQRLDDGKYQHKQADTKPSQRIEHEENISF